MTTRLPYGIGTAAKRKPFGNFGWPDPLRYGELYSDFTGIDYNAAAWTVTETQAGATQALVAADTADEFGLVALVNAAGAADINSIQLTTAQLLLTNTTRKWWARVRMSRDNADERMGGGVQAVNATPFTLSSGIWMIVDGASTSATFAIGKAAATTTAVVTSAYPTSALNTFIDLGMSYDGKSKIDCFVDGVKRAEITTLTNLPNTVALLLTLSSANTTANARTVHADYVGFWVERTAANAGA